MKQFIIVLITIITFQKNKSIFLSIYITRSKNCLLFCKKKSFNSSLKP